jgi:hypothetical protein
MSGIFHHLMAYVFDPFWKYVTLLLHGNGTNGAQNNTFIDSSSNAFTITRNGSATQGSFSPYGPDWSNYFNGTSNSFSVPANTAFAFGQSDFTVQMWIYPTATITSPANIGLFYIEQTNGLVVGLVNGYIAMGLRTIGYDLTSTYIPPLNTWTHIAVTRSSATTYIFANGVLVGTATAPGGNPANNSNYVCTTGLPTIAGNYAGGAGFGYFPGYISNVQIVKGTAVYTTAFTPPTAPLTAITNTSLLTCQSNRFIDNSANAFVITIAGTPFIQRFSPFSMGSTYSASVINGSGYFNGSTDSLAAPANTAFAFGQGDFTVQMWIYPTMATITSPANIGLFYIEQTNGLVVGLNNGYIAMGQRTTGYNLISTYIPILNTWTHIAITRSSATTYIFANGSLVGTITSSGGNPANNINYVCTTGLPTIAGNYGGGAAFGYFTGYISNIQVVKGTAVYTAAFTAPTAPVTAITNTSLLLNYTNAGIYDNAMMNNLITVGNAQISTAQFKFGGASMYFDGAGDYLITNVPTNNLYIFGPSDFTIEFWLYSVNFSTPVNTQIVVDFRPTSIDGAYPCIYFVSGQIFYYVSSTNVITGTTLSSSQWYHIALSRSGTNTKLFVNGTQVGSTYTDSNSYLCGANRPAIGCRGFLLGDNSYNGYIDDLRITKAARYTANFTPPTSQLLDY